jgi:uncharacterized membrane protein
MVVIQEYFMSFTNLKIRPQIRVASIVTKAMMLSHLLLLGTTALVGLPSLAMADDVMVNLADTDGNGTVDGTASEWAIGNSYAYAMSSDGSVIAGSGNDGTTSRAFRWDATTGMVNLADTNRNGTVDGTASEWAIGSSYASEMSSDGSVIAGEGSDGTTRRAFRWDATTGMVNLADTNRNGTVDGTVSEWAIGSSYATLMSSDGSVIAGSGNDGTTSRAFR